MRRCSYRLSWLVMVVATASISASAMAQPALVELLAGRWSGWGNVTLAGGQAEEVKCIATYTAATAAVGIEQGLRCASASYRIDATALLAFEGEVVTGAWTERANASTGTISGRASSAGLLLAIGGDTFSASLVLTASACKHAIVISPDGLAVSRIAIRFERC